MTQEERNLLVKDLCVRLPYDVIVKKEYTFVYTNGTISKSKEIEKINLEDIEYLISGDDCVDVLKPYLRPMSSMTEKEKDDLLRFFSFPLGAMYFNPNWGYVEVFKYIDEIKIYINDIVGLIDWLNKNMFDYRDLIPKGLAFEAKEGMYNH